MAQQSVSKSRLIVSAMLLKHLTVSAYVVCFYIGWHTRGKVTLLVVCMASERNDSTDKCSTIGWHVHLC